MDSEREKIISNLFKKADPKDNSLSVLMISTDKNIFKIGSAARERMAEYGKLFRQLHIIVFTKRFQKFKADKISENVWVYPTRSWTRWLYALDAIKVAKLQFAKFLPKIISVISAQDPFETGIVGWLIARKFNLPLQIQIHTDFLSPYFAAESLLNRARVRIAKFLIPHASSIRVVSERIKNSLKFMNHKLKAEPVVLPIFVDIAKIKNFIPLFEIHKKYPQFSFIILMVSRLEKEKNITLAIEIMKGLTVRYPRIGMIIIGEGRQRKNLENLIAKYNLKENIIFEGWQNDTVSYYKTANLFLLTSLYEGYGLAIIEALASGCPIVSSDSGIAGEMISKGNNGFVCPVKDKNCFVRKILEILGKPSLRIGLNINSKELISDKLIESKESYLSKYRQIMEDCLNKG